LLSVDFLAPEALRPYMQLALASYGKAACGHGRRAGSGCCFALCRVALRSLACDFIRARSSASIVHAAGVFVPHGETSRRSGPARGQVLLLQFQRVGVLRFARWQQ
jgi:hypothetical protein